jgi:hypothetical protein
VTPLLSSIPLNASRLANVDKKERGKEGKIRTAKGRKLESTDTGSAGTYITQQLPAV